MGSNFLEVLDWPNRYPKVAVRVCVYVCVCMYMCTPSPYRLPSNARSVDKRSLTVFVWLSKFWVLLRGNLFAPPGGSEGCAEEESK